MINRLLSSKIIEKWGSDKIIIVTGPRQVGKTTLIKNVCEKYGNYLFINGDDASARAEFSEPSEKYLRQAIGNHKILFIDEAQRIENIGLILKIISRSIEGCKGHRKWLLCT